MQGEFRADVTRDTFDRRHLFSRVIMQQGRVFLDADWNEQTSILLDYLRTLAMDVIGPHAGPGDGFQIDENDEAGTALPKGFGLRRGRYYVDGFLCENPGFRLYGDAAARPVLGVDGEPRAGAGTFIAYLDVWERHVTALAVPEIAEIALNGPDTATRAQVVWEVRALVPQAGDPVNTKAAAEQTFRQRVTAPTTVALRARVDPGEPSTAPCTIDPEARYRGAENQLYRIEIHRGGAAGTGANNADAATFTWSRDNGSVEIPIRSMSQGKVRVTTLGRDDRRSLHENEWVEIVDAAQPGRKRRLWQIAALQRDDLVVTLKPQDGIPLPEVPPDPQRRLSLRRWDHGGDPAVLSEGAIVVRESAAADEDGWITLEDGIQVSFAAGAGHVYRAGDYWLIPARTQTGGLLWPPSPADRTADPYPAVAPHGVEHHYAPLAVVTVDNNGQITSPPLALRNVIHPVGS